jgi:sigma-B regulation protein RsbU (phosphoserine phosphatase)
MLLVVVGLVYFVGQRRELKRLIALQGAVRATETAVQDTLVAVMRRALRDREAPQGGASPTEPASPEQSALVGREASVALAQLEPRRGPLLRQLEAFWGMARPPRPPPRLLATLDVEATALRATLGQWRRGLMDERARTAQRSRQVLFGWGLACVLLMGGGVVLWSATAPRPVDPVPSGAPADVVAPGEASAPRKPRRTTPKPADGPVGRRGGAEVPLGPGALRDETSPGRSSTSRRGVVLGPPEEGVIPDGVDSELSSDSISIEFTPEPEQVEVFDEQKVTRRALVLCVDPNPVNLDVLRLRLERENYRVRTAATSNEALAAVEKELPDLIVLELALEGDQRRGGNITRDGMPSGAAGYQLFERIRRRRGAAQLPFLFLTHREIDPSRLRGSGMMGVDYLIKPINPELLLAKLSAILQRKDADLQLGRMQEELETAGTVQRTLLPSPAYDVGGLEIRGFVKPAADVGGDWYGYYHRPMDSTVMLCVGDVEGHGAGAALLTAAIYSFKVTLEEIMGRAATPRRVGGSREEARAWLAPADLDDVDKLLALPGSPSEILRALNRLFRASSRLRASFQVAALDYDRGRIRLANAGHPAPLIYRAATGEVESLLTPASELMGEHDDLRTVESTAPMGPGDVLAFYSDGLIEGVSPEGKPYGAGRLGRAFKRFGQAAADRIRDELLNDAFSFFRKARQMDDVTLVICKRRG